MRGADTSGDDAKARQDFDDYQNEAFGRDTGRIERFGVGPSRDAATQQKERREAAYRDALHYLLMTDPEYRRVYEDLGERLSGAETNADQQIADLQDALEQTQATLDEMLDAAPRIEGNAVFRTLDGNVVNEHGDVIEGLSADDIVWPQGAASAEDFFMARQRVAELQAALVQWHEYRGDVLGSIRDRYDDRDNPMSMDDLRRAIEEIERSAPDAPEIAASQSDTLNPVSAAPTSLLTLD